MLTIERNKLDAKLPRDQAPADIPVQRHASQKLPKGKKELRRKSTDRQAIERGEDEGMILGSR